ncbi:tyrosine-type recombinase/integrase [Reinekea marinisedimentorum]|uniref:Phage integrase family protein n=1 Tax=Reinekea marinisedimentorum TaxID=230495 RepID=A0A4R3HXK9_9GAMM|nr:tyrosine-type recombinase/integrase [Reinekea marinisedimentorum]TCS38077.1 phage integrase family protein [Reinekea marinisedimentorum]
MPIVTPTGQDSCRQPVTLIVAEHTVNKYLKDYAKKPLINITEEIVKKEHARISAFSHAQADAVMRLLRAIFNYAKYEYRGVDNSFIFALNPVEILSHHRLWNNVGRRNTRITIGQLPDWFKGLEAVRQTGDSFTVAVCDLAEMAILTGLRRSELLSLRWEQVNLTEKTYYLSKTKNGEPLELPIGDRVLEILQSRYKVKDVIGFVFNTDNAYGVIKEPKKALTKIRTETGIEFSLHDLRRTFTTTAESINVGQYMIKRLLNHKTRRDDVTAGYIVLTPEELRVPAQQIENRILEHAGILLSEDTHKNEGSTDKTLLELLAKLSEKQKQDLIESIKEENK